MHRKKHFDICFILKYWIFERTQENHLRIFQEVQVEISIDSERKFHRDIPMIEKKRFGADNSMLKSAL